MPQEETSSVGLHDPGENIVGIGFVHFFPEGSGAKYKLLTNTLFFTNHTRHTETRQEETAQRSFLSNFGIVGTRAVLPVRYLSGGQRMRVALAVVLYRRPDMLILDEVSVLLRICVDLIERFY